MVTLEEVKALLDPEEPDYDRVAGLEPEALAHLETLCDSGDEMLASKATYAASLLAADAGADLVGRAADSDVDAGRLAAAAGLKNLGPERAADVAASLVTDGDDGVVKIAQQSAVAHGDRLVAEVVSSGPGTAVMPEPSATPLAAEDGLMPGEQPVSGDDRDDGLMPGETTAPAAAAGEAPDTMNEGSPSDRGGRMPGEDGPG